MDKDPLLNVEEVAAQLRIHPETVRRFIRTKQLAAIHMGPRSGYRIEQSAVDTFKKRRGTMTSEEQEKEDSSAEAA